MTDRRYRVARSLSLQVDPIGNLVASTSALRTPAVISPEAVYLLQAFAPGRTRAEAFAAMSGEWELDAESFSELVDRLVAETLLVTTNGAGAAPSSPPVGEELVRTWLPAHHRRLTDAIRLGAYRSAILAHAPGKSVVEIGCGTGVLSLFAAQCGARRVVAIEETPIAVLAEEMVRANGYEDVVKVIWGNSRDAVLDEPADLVIHEMVGTDPYSLNVPAYVSDAWRRFLRPGGRIMPSRLEIRVAGIEVHERDVTTIGHVVREARELEQLYGLSFAPYIRRFEETTFLNWSDAGARSFPHRLLTRDDMLYDLDFSADRDHGAGPWRVPLTVDEGGTLNGIVLYFRAHLDERIQLTNAPFASKTSWGWHVRPLNRERRVEAGDTVELHARLTGISGRSYVDFRLG